MTHDPICPRCQQLNSKVIDTRRSMAGSVWRRRECCALILVDGIEQVCGQRFTTYEQVNTAPRMRALMVSLSIGRDVSS